MELSIIEDIIMIRHKSHTHPRTHARMHPDPRAHHTHINKQTHTHTYIYNIQTHVLFVT
jgi:hypothetical protein